MIDGREASAADRRSTQARIALLGVLILAAAIYLNQLGRAPVYLGWDEARTAMQGFALATTSRDMNGHRLPLFFHITDPLIPNHSSSTWWQPTLFYLTAAVLSVAPLAEWSVRLPNILLALVNISLVAAIGRRIFANPWYGVLAAVMLTLTPVHFLFARLAQDYFLPQTFAMLWLWCFVSYLSNARTWLAVLMGFVLGAGIYTHVSAWLTMPFYLAVTTLVLLALHRHPRSMLLVWAGFGLAMLPLMVWLWFMPTMFQDMFANYKVVTSPSGLERVSLYWEYFNPSYLFFSGGTDPMWATRKAGVFLLAFAVLLPCGIWSIWRKTRSIPRSLLLVGFFFVPVPIVATLPEAPHYATARALMVGPFGALIAAAGVEFLLAKRTLIPTAAAALLLLSLPLQFAGFAHDYLTDYQRRSSYRHDHLNLRAVAEYVIARDATARVPGVYFVDTLGGGKMVQWQFYLQTHGRPDLWTRTAYLLAQPLRDQAVPPGSLLVMSASDPRKQDLLSSNEATVLQVVNDITGEPAAAILQRQ